ncbi:hypothetical protein EBN88_01620 [Streptomyces triticirhizae]|uniref:YitT family protein n=1 Tax=Streptomyces triticirhizae TaxID=2483353 RepID=A0A3M2MAB6_9ACTN|nr:hypothetical protein EBN88_01620 [Streptomyces triticirhizae]
MHDVSYKPVSLPRRLATLLLGLALFGCSLGLLVRAELGLPSWDVLHQGLAERTGAPLGLVVTLVGVLVLLAWIPLRERPGVGTVGNVLLVGIAAEITLELVPTLDALPLRWAVLATGVGTGAVATGLYVGAGLGPGPRDGLMTGLARRGLSIRRARTGIELGVLAVGWLLGGPVGLGTVLYALTIGPLTQLALTWLSLPPPAPRAAAGSSLRV